jgi:hypothetical protein
MTHLSINTRTIIKIAMNSSHNVTRAQISVYVTLYISHLNIAMVSEPLLFITGSKTFEITDYCIIKSISNTDSIESEHFPVGGYN